MYRKSVYLLPFLFLLCLFSVKSALAVPAITTQGNQVLIGGERGSLAGNSFYWTNFGGDAYYNRNVVSWLQEDWNTTIVRAAMGIQEFNGFLSNRDTNFNAVVSLVDAAIAEDVYVIIDWHSHSAEFNRNEAVQFFSEMAERYGDNENVLFEIYNEPIDATWDTIRDYAAPVIAAIREHSDNLIIVGTPFFSQRVDIASENPIRGAGNLAYTFHFYAGTHGESLRNQARTALRNGIPLFVTEWGTVNADGNGGANESSTREWMDFLEENNISHLNWSINDLNEGASVIFGNGQGQGNNGQGANNQGNWPSSLLTPSGSLARDIIRDWPTVLVDDDDGDSLVHIQKNNVNFAIDGNRGGATAQNVYIWTSSQSNINQQWIEIDRGNGFYSYQKNRTSFCLDGGNGGSRRQSVYLWTCGANNQNQHWRKVNTASGSFRLEKRNAPGFSLDAGAGGANAQDLYLWNSNDNNVNQQWNFTTLD